MIFDELVSRWLTEKYDETLFTKVELLQTLNSIDDEGLEFEFADEFMKEFSREISPEYFQIWINGDQVFERSQSLNENDLPRSKSVLKAPLDKKIVSNIRLPDKRNGRIVYVTFHPQLEDDADEFHPQLEDDVDESFHNRTQEIPILTLAVAMERESLDGSIYQANLILLLAFSLILLTLSFVVWFSVKRGLQPLDELQNQLRKINYKSHGCYIELEHLPIELEALQQKFNLLLDNVRSGLDRERQFSSDVAHELRTPIAEVRTISEVALIGHEDAYSLTNSIKDILHVSVHMNHLVDKLLVLARSEASSNDINKEAIDVKKLIDDFIAFYLEQSKERNLDIHFSCLGDNIFFTSIVEFKQIICNLISNSVYHATLGSSIKIRWEGYREFVFSITNITDNLTQEDLPQLFTRLWKKDSSRTDIERAGIGLSLVEIYCEKLNYEVTPYIEDSEFSIFLTGKT